MSASHYSLINIFAWVCEGSRGTGALEFRARELHAPYVSADLRVLLEFLEPWGIFPAEKIAGFSSVLFSKGTVKWDHNDSISTVPALLHSENSILSSKCDCFLFPWSQRLLSILKFSRDLLQHNFVLIHLRKKKMQFKTKFHTKYCWKWAMLKNQDFRM